MTTLWGSAKHWYQISPELDSELVANTVASDNTMSGVTNALAYRPLPAFKIYKINDILKTRGRYAATITLTLTPTIYTNRNPSFFRTNDAPL